MRSTSLTTNAEIIRAAAKIFRQKGYHGASMRDIASAVGLLKGSLYHHISSKQDLLMAICVDGMATAIDPLEEIAASDLPPITKLTQAIATHIQVITEHLDEAAVFLREGHHLAPESRQAFIAERDRFEKIFQQIIQEGIDAGQLRPVDIPIVINAILGINNWLVQWYDENGRLSAAEIGAIFIDLILHGLQAEAPAKKRD